MSVFYFAVTVSWQWNIHEEIVVHNIQYSCVLGQWRSLSISHAEGAHLTHYPI
jgi:hypothetical protein